jgi:hypothetical protein
LDEDHEEQVFIIHKYRNKFKDVTLC